MHILNPRTFLLRRHCTAGDPLTTAALLITAGFFHSPALSLLCINSLLRSLSFGHFSLSYLKLMLSACSPLPRPDHLTFSFVLNSCAVSNSFCGGVQVHALVVKNGMCSSDGYVQTGLLKVYSRELKVVRKLFDEMVELKNQVHLDVVMSSYIRAGQPSNALNVFKKILANSRIELDCFVLTTALKACAQADDLNQGLWIHRYLERRDSNNNYLKDNFIASALVNMYSKCGCINDAIKVFDKMPQRNNYMWSVIISSFATHGFAKEAINCLKTMQEKDNLKPDGITLLGVLTACSHSGFVDQGLVIFQQMEGQFGIKPKHEHFACTIDMLCRVGRLEEAFGLIRKMPMKPLVSVWGAFINGCKIYKNAELAERALVEIKKLSLTSGIHKILEDEGFNVQLYNIYLDVGKKEEARKIRKKLGVGSVKKTRAMSEICVDGITSSFVSGDLNHDLSLEIWRVLDVLKDQMGESERIQDEFLLDS